MSDVRFDDRVAIVTGAGGGLGRAHALLLASRGAKVVVNDLGGGRDGTGAPSSEMANKVVEEIKAAGGEAVADAHGVDTAEGGEAIVKTALDAFGKVDIVIANAGILRDRAFHNLTEEDWDKIFAVHVKGSFNVVQPAFRVMRQNNYGRIIVTTSNAGLYGNFGQANYSSAKTAVLGFASTLELEGAKYNIKANVIAPVAASRLTEDVMPPGRARAAEAGAGLADGGVPLLGGVPGVRQHLHRRRRLLGRAAIVEGKGAVIPERQPRGHPRQLLEDRRHDRTPRSSPTPSTKSRSAFWRRTGAPS